MTLIVGRIQNNQTYIFGDTELTYENRFKSNPYIDGCLKQYLIGDNLVVAFAGVKEHFEAVCPRIFSCTHEEEVIEIALSEQAKGKKFEILVAENGKEKIGFVKNGKVSSSVAGYLGDHDAFEAYQKYFHNFSNNGLETELGHAQIHILRIPEPNVQSGIYLQMYSSIKKVIEDTRILGVGGVIVPLCTDKGKFRYMNYADIFSDPLKIDDFNENPKRIDFGTASGGGYSVEFIDDTHFGGNGKNVGWYFIQGGFGVVFPPSLNGFRKAKLIKAKNPAFWVLETDKLLGIGIASQYLSIDHCGIAGEELLQKGQYKDAKFCYELECAEKLENKKPELHDRYLAGYAVALFNCGLRFDSIKLLEVALEKHNDYKRCKKIITKLKQNIENES